MNACTIPGLKIPVKCGVHLVDENRNIKTGRKIGIRVVVVEATRTPRAADPLVILVGGPGSGATQIAGQLGGTGNRDVVLIDQRGTGESNPLRCSIGHTLDQVRLLDDQYPKPLIDACLAEARKLGDLSQYSTLAAA